jgi:transposase
MRYELTGYEWTAVRPMLPNKPRGVPRVNDRRVLNGIFWVGTHYYSNLLAVPARSRSHLCYSATHSRGPSSRRPSRATPIRSASSG